MAEGTEHSQKRKSRAGETAGGQTIVIGSDAYEKKNTNTDSDVDKSERQNIKGGTYIVGTDTSNPYGTYKNDLDKLTQAQRQAQVDALKAARTTALANLDAQEQTIKPYYETARNQTAAASQQGARSFAEYLANRGLTNSGAAAQGETNRLSALTNNLGTINNAEANAYRDIANQRTQVENNYAANLANANNSITQDYYNNLLNYNEQQRQYIQQLQNQALGQYAGDYQAYINTLTPGSVEYWQAMAARGNKVAGNYSNAYNYNTSLNKIASGSWDYNDLLATGMTNEQATKYYNDTVAARQAQLEQEAEQTAYERQKAENEYLLNKQKVDNDTLQTQYNVGKPYNTTVYHVSSGGKQGNESTNEEEVGKSVLNTLIDMKIIDKDKAQEIATEAGWYKG